MKKIRVGLLFGGRSAEHEVSILSARAVYENIDREKYEVVPFAIDRKGFWLDPKRSTKILENKKIKEAYFKFNLENKERISQSLKPFLEEELDVVFPVLHGPYGEDGKLQGFLESIDLDYVGAGVLASAVGMDKAVMKDLFSKKCIPQGEYITVRRYNFIDKYKEIIRQVNENIAWPCFVKPANMGSSIGISKVSEENDLQKALENAFEYDEKVLIEEYIEGREIECSVLGNHELQVSLPGEIIAENDFYDYEAKYEEQSTKLCIPAKIDKNIINKLQIIAQKVFRTVDAKGFARVDFFLRKNDQEILVNEINTIPGFTEYSMYAKLWEETGLKYSELINKLIILALE